VSLAGASGRVLLAGGLGGSHMALSRRGKQQRAAAWVATACVLAWDILLWAAAAGGNTAAGLAAAALVSLALAALVVARRGRALADAAAAAPMVPALAATLLGTASAASPQRIIGRRQTYSDIRRTASIFKVQAQPRVSDGGDAPASHSSGANERTCGAASGAECAPPAARGAPAFGMPRRRLLIRKLSGGLGTAPATRGALSLALPRCLRCAPPPACPAPARQPSAAATTTARG